MDTDYGVELKKHRKIILKFQKKSSVCAKLARALSSSSLAPVVLYFFIIIKHIETGLEIQISI